jgi:hypothetical protein
MAVMRTGKRCPNQAEPGSRYCSIHADYVEPARPAAAAPEAEASADEQPAETPGPEASEE